MRGFDANEVCASGFVGTLQIRWSILIRPRESADCQCDAVGVGVAGIGGGQAGDIGGSPEAIADRIRVYEQRSCRGLDGRAGVQVTGDRLDQSLIGQREVDLGDQLLDRLIVSGQGPLGE